MTEEITSIVIPSNCFCSIEELMFIAAALGNENVGSLKR